MRRLKATAVTAAMLLSSCTTTPMVQNEFSTPFFTNFADVASRENQYHPPYGLSYPDETMYFYRIWEYHPRADLNLRAIHCSRTSDGALVVTASVQNMGADIVPAVPNFNGDRASLRIAAVVTWSDGSTEEVDAFVPVTIPVTGTVDVPLARTRYQFNEVRRIDVVADPDRIVPDPVRINNVLSWQGTMASDSPRCDTVRS